VGHGSALVSCPLDFKRHRGPKLRSPALEPCGQLVSCAAQAVWGSGAAISPLPLQIDSTFSFLRRLPTRFEPLVSRRKRPG
jgi:hypothetical protein